MMAREEDIHQDDEPPSLQESWALSATTKSKNSHGKAGKAILHLIALKATTA